MTWTSAVGRSCKWLLYKIVHGLALTRISPNALTFIGLLINVVAGILFGYAHAENQRRIFLYAGLVIIGAGIFDMVDGRVARATNQVTQFGGFFDSIIDRYSDVALFFGLLVYYARANRFFYVVMVAFVMVSSVMVSYARARAESLIPSCKVGFMERPERIVLFMIGASTNRMAAVLWVVLVLSVLAVANRIYYTYLALNKLPMPTRDGVAGFFSRAFFWTDERATLSYDLWVIAILAFVWLTPPDWLGDPTASGPGLLGYLASKL
jgi:CDP-diacylglycerol--glycerol-3-phosphate 3-phosphatidyltransferase